MHSKWKHGPLSTDLGIDGVTLDVTTGGIAIVVDGFLRGYVSADELRLVLKAADERCPTCGQRKP